MYNECEHGRACACVRMCYNVCACISQCMFECARVRVCCVHVCVRALVCVCVFLHWLIYQVTHSSHIIDTFSNIRYFIRSFQLHFMKHSFGIVKQSMLCNFTINTCDLSIIVAAIISF